MAATSVQKISPIWWKNRPHPPQILLKNLKMSKNFKKTLPPLKICESVTLTKLFFLFGLTLHNVMFIVCECLLRLPNLHIFHKSRNVTMEWLIVLLLCLLLA
jgi:hypothetical protein